MSENFKIISCPDVSGSISLKYDQNAKIRLKLTLSKPLDETDVLKVLLSSSESLKESPLYCGLAETEGVHCCFSKTVELPTNLQNPDTVEIQRKNVFTEETEPFLKICFKSDVEQSHSVTNQDLLCELDVLKKRLDTLQNNIAYRDFLNVSEDIKSPVERASDILESLHRLRSSSPADGLNEKHMNEIRSFVQKYEKTPLNCAPDFLWYRIPSDTPPCSASAFEHVLKYPDANACIKIFAHYLLGIKKTDNIICIAIPVADKTPNPLSHVDDCTVYITPSGAPAKYCTVCVSLEPDGQYFMPLA